MWIFIVGDYRQNPREEQVKTHIQHNLGASM